MKKKYDIDEFYSGVIKNIKENELNSIFPSYFYKSLYDGQNNYYQKEQIESKKFDELWIRTIESYFPSINRITVNLKSTLKYQSEITPIEKTKKINKESVIHLMSHSNFVKEITEDGVIPKQVLTSIPEIEYGIYENRFIMTLINRLRDFISKRVKLMKKELKASKVIHMNLNSKFKFEQADFELSVDIKQIEEVSRRKIDEHNTMALERAEKLLRLITRLHNTQFMKILRRFKPVTSPIMKTQIILSNSDFKNAYLLWLYLDRYNELGYDLSLDTTNKRFTQAYTKRVNQALMLMCTTMLANDKSESENSTNNKAVYKEKPAKTVLKLPLEVDIDPIAYEINDTGVNEYYLSKYKQILNRQFNESIKEGNSYKVALKKALGDSLSITNALYESFFEVNADEDVFQQLLKEDDPEKMYKEAFDKYLVSCSIREVKEQDFKRAISLEKKWQQQMLTLKRKLLENCADLAKKNKNKILEELRNSYKETLDVCMAKDFREKQQKMKAHRMQTDVFRKKLNQDFREKKKKIAEETQKKLTAERERVKKQAQANKLKAEAQFKLSLKRLIKEQEAKIKQLEVFYKDKFQKDKEKIINEANISITKQKERVKKLEENREIRNNKLLEERKQKMEAQLQQRKEKLENRYQAMILEEKDKQERQ